MNFVFKTLLLLSTFAPPSRALGEGVGEQLEIPLSVTLDAEYVTDAMCLFNDSKPDEIICKDSFLYESGLLQKEKKSLLEPEAPSTALDVVDLPESEMEKGVEEYSKVPITDGVDDDLIGEAQKNIQSTDDKTEESGLLLFRPGVKYFLKEQMILIVNKRNLSIQILRKKKNEDSEQNDKDFGDDNTVSQEKDKYSLFLGETANVPSLGSSVLADSRCSESRCFYSINGEQLLSADRFSLFSKTTCPKLAETGIESLQRGGKDTACYSQGLVGTVYFKEALLDGGELFLLNRGAPGNLTGLNLGLGKITSSELKREWNFFYGHTSERRNGSYYSRKVHSDQPPTFGLSVFFPGERKVFRLASVSSYLEETRRGVAALRFSLRPASSSHSVSLQNKVFYEPGFWGHNESLSHTFKSMHSRFSVLNNINYQLDRVDGVPEEEGGKRKSTNNSKRIEGERLSAQSSTQYSWSRVNLGMGVNGSYSDQTGEMSGLSSIGTQLGEVSVRLSMTRALWTSDGKVDPGKLWTSTLSVSWAPSSPSSLSSSLKGSVSSSIRTKDNGESTSSNSLSVGQRIKTDKSSLSSRHAFRHERSILSEYERLNVASEMIYENPYTHIRGNTSVPVAGKPLTQANYGIGLRSSVLLTPHFFMLKKDQSLFRPHLLIETENPYINSVSPKSTRSKKSPEVVSFSSKKISVHERALIGNNSSGYSTALTTELSEEADELESGVKISPEFVTENYQTPGVHSVEVKAESSRLVEFMIQHKDGTPALQRLVAYIKIGDREDEELVVFIDGSAWHEVPETEDSFTLFSVSGEILYQGDLPKEDVVRFFIKRSDIDE